MPKDLDCGLPAPVADLSLNTSAPAKNRMERKLYFFQRTTCYKGSRNTHILSTVYHVKGIIPKGRIVKFVITCTCIVLVLNGKRMNIYRSVLQICLQLQTNRQQNITVVQTIMRENDSSKQVTKIIISMTMFV
jgi:hypothetical protein